MVSYDRRPLRCLAFTARLALGCALGVTARHSLGAGAASPLLLVDTPFDPPVTRIYSVDPAAGTMALAADLGTARSPILGMAAASGTVLYLAGTDPTGALCAGRACLLLRVVLDPSSTTPTEVALVGPILDGTAEVSGIVGMTFRGDGVLYAISQDTGGLYTIDTSTALASLVGSANLELDGGDITFDAEDRLWGWTNSGAASGLYELDPASGAASVFDLHPGMSLSGMAALAHSDALYGSDPDDDSLYAIDPSVGLTGAHVPLTLDGAPFDATRGDLDSPFCADDAACDDFDLCTSDLCSPGGCAHAPLPLDDGDACTADGCDPATGPFHQDLRGVDTDGDGVADCVDACPGTLPGDATDRSGCALDQLCPCEGPRTGGAWSNHGAYVRCVVLAARSHVQSGGGIHGLGRIVRGAAHSSCGRGRHGGAASGADSSRGDPGR